MGDFDTVLLLAKIWSTIFSPVGSFERSTFVVVPRLLILLIWKKVLLMSR